MRYVSTFIQNTKEINLTSFPERVSFHAILTRVGSLKECEPAQVLRELNFLFVEVGQVTFPRNDSSFVSKAENTPLLFYRHAQEINGFLCI